jgi:hypothetical protein
MWETKVFSVHKNYETHTHEQPSKTDDSAGVFTTKWFARRGTTTNSKTLILRFPKHHATKAWCGCHVA